MKQTAVEFTRLVVLYNPRSSNAGRTKGIIARLEKAYPGKLVIISLKQSAAQNLKMLRDTLKEGDILVPCGGDGTIGGVVEYLLYPTMPKELRRTPVLPVGTGRMNDVARMANGRHFIDPLFALKHGQLLDIYPVACTCTPLSGKGKPVTRLVIYNIGFGYSGRCSVAWNDPKFRANIQKRTRVTRPVKFFKTGTDLLKDATYFDVTYKGRRRTVLDVTAAVGHIYGGYYRLPVRLSDRDFYFVITDDKSFLGTVKAIAELITNKYKGGTLTTSANFTLHSPVLAHVGGETFRPPAPCRVQIAPLKEPITLITTSPKA
jgi:diacylglycerol kinase family enzyme